MLKRIKIKNSVILFSGILIIIIGIYIGFLDYFIEKKEKAFADMNILLYENENPDNVNSDEIIEEKKEEIEENTEDDNSHNNIQYDYIGILEIPKINLKRGFLSLDSKYNNVNYNITVINYIK